MDRQPVESSNIASVGYEADSMTLEVEFLSGAVYQYQGVPEYAFQEFLGSPSKGAYFSEFIRNVYSTVRVV